MRSPLYRPGDEYEEVPILYQTPVSTNRAENKRELPPHMEIPRKTQPGSGQESVLNADQERLVQQAELMLTSEQLVRILKRREKRDMNEDPEEKAFKTWKEGQYWANTEPVKTHQPINANHPSVKEQQSQSGDRERSKELWDKHEQDIEETKKKLNKLTAHLAKEENKYKCIRPDVPALDNSNPVAKLVGQMVKPKGLGTSRTPHKLNPINQIPVTSYIGRSLGKIEKAGGADSDNSSDESDSSSSGDSSNTSTDNDFQVSSLGPRLQTNRVKSHRRKKRKEILKPTELAAYDRKPDSRELHRFVTAATAYVKVGQVPRAN
ncbi:hypothetical protein SERLADRAFT_432174 [Serpula lacrymans var. lacrymans S7.9]|uniref:Uncharacterized protein n=1 Tax=Serpula lacrymans var. lacrymans (strain S7.9) TaxID=578457 RepID=F8NEG7_SERL9|nr:uncharacterized protein SERLADRAFT_432174 [Serpula lacrymans var. lacrymans S7.9]EGO30601.1 hypothetical protein SERLADRAFT_432174 [Serpula lacrymans var. lacrymans S7.9]